MCCKSFTCITITHCDSEAVDSMKLKINELKRRLRMIIIIIMIIIIVIVFVIIIIFTITIIIFITIIIIYLSTNIYTSTYLSTHLYLYIYLLITTFLSINQSINLSIYLYKSHALLPPPSFILLKHRLHEFLQASSEHARRSVSKD